MGDTNAKQKNGQLDLSHLTPEEIAKQVLETPPPPERESKKEAARLKREYRGDAEKKEAS